MFARVGELPRRYWRVTVLLVAFGVVNFPDALLLLRLNEIGFSVAEVILAYVGYNLVYAVSSYPAGLLADRIGRPAVFGIGLVFFAIGYTGLGLTTDTVAAWLLIGVYGLFTGCTDGVGKAWISSLVGSDLQASAQGLPGRQRFCRVGGGAVGRFPVGSRRPAAAAGIRSHRRGVRGRVARARAALRTWHDELDIVERKGGSPTPADRIGSPRRALGDAGLHVAHRSVTVTGFLKSSLGSDAKTVPASDIDRRSDRYCRSFGPGRHARRRRS